MQINQYIHDFIKHVENGKIEIYNEFSLQHELGLFLRRRLEGTTWRVQFERNITFFNISNTIKHEIDIVIFNESERYAIELKMPLHGQVPEQMYAFVKDIRFMEQLKAAGFTKTYCLTFVEDRLFFQGTKVDGVYAYFRTDVKLEGKINKPTGKHTTSITLDNAYDIHWCSCGNRYYYCIEI